MASLIKRAVRYRLIGTLIIIAGAMFWVWVIMPVYHGWIQLFH